MPYLSLPFFRGHETPRCGLGQDLWEGKVKVRNSQGELTHSSSGRTPGGLAGQMQRAALGRHKQERERERGQSQASPPTYHPPYKLLLPHSIFGIEP